MIERWHGGAALEQRKASPLGAARGTVGRGYDNPPWLELTPERLAVAQQFIDSIQFE